jgi:hypothetical protein
MISHPGGVSRRDKSELIHRQDNLGKMPKSTPATEFRA